MPNQPYGVSHDRTNHFRDSGAQVLLAFGRVLIDLAQGMRPAPFRTPTPDGPVPGDVDDCEKAVQEFFGTHPRAKLRPWLLPRGGAKEVDLRISRVVAALAAHHVLDGHASVPVLSLARVCAADGQPAEILEWRRVVAACGVSGVVQVADEGGLFAKVMLGSDTLVAILGGEESIPVLAADELQRLGEQGRNACAAGRAAKAGRHSDAASFVKAIPLLRPRELFDEMGRRGFVGQEPARRAISLAAYRHVRRLRRVHLEGTPALIVPNRENLLLRSPTGTGKTFMTRLLCEILGLPHVIIDLTMFSETGYVGEDPVSILTRLLIAAEGNAEVAQLGIAALDEFDKLAEPMGSGRSSHVSRGGVARSLLKLLDGGHVDCPSALGHPLRSSRVSFDTSQILWVALGAFTGWEQAADRGPIGFGARRPGPGASPRQTVRDYERYGLMPELLSRFHRWVAMESLSRDQLDAILGKAVRLYTDELALDGIRLGIDRDALRLVVDRAVERGTNARGIHAELAEALTDACYEAYSEGGGATVRLRAADGGIAWDVSKRAVAADPLMDLNEMSRIVGQTAETGASA